MTEIDWNNKQQVLKAVKNSGFDLQYASKEFQNDKEIVLVAVNQTGSALQYASKELQNDKDVVLAAVKQDGYYLEYASDELKNDKDIVLAAIKKNTYALQIASQELQNNYDLLNLVQQYHIDNDITNYTKRYQTWYYERMTVLDILNEQELLEKNIPINNTMKTKQKKF